MVGTQDGADTIRPYECLPRYGRWIAGFDPGRGNGLMIFACFLPGDKIRRLRREIELLLCLLPSDQKIRQFYLRSNVPAIESSIG